MPALVKPYPATNWLPKKDLPFLKRERKRIPGSWIDDRVIPNNTGGRRRKPCVRHFYQLLFFVHPSYFAAEIHHSDRRRVIFCEADCKKWQCWFYTAQAKKNTSWDYDVCVAGCGGRPILGNED